MLLVGYLYEESPVILPTSHHNKLSQGKQPLHCNFQSPYIQKTSRVRAREICFSKQGTYCIFKHILQNHSPPHIMTCISTCYFFLVL
jgi:hypothetical protein